MLIASRLRGASDLTLSFVMAAAYLLAATLGRLLSVEDHQVATLWPPAGLLVGTLAALGRPRARAVVGGALVGNVAFNLLVGFGPALSLAFSAANVLEGLAGAWLLRRASPPLDTSNRIGTRFVVAVVVAATLAPALGAAIGALCVHLATGADFGLSWATWWSADALGIVAIAPLTLLLLSPTLRDEPIDAGAAEALLVIAALPAVSVAAVHGVFERAEPSFVFPLLLWAAVRLGLAGGIVASGLFALSAVAASAWQAADAASHAMLQTEVALFSVITLLAGALLRKRRVQLAEPGAARGAADTGHEAALAVAGAGTWTCDLPDFACHADARTTRLYGLVTDPAGCVDPMAWLARVHPEDRARVRRDVRRALLGATPFASEHRVPQPDGTLRWLAAYGRLADGRGPLCGVSIDVTGPVVERQQAAAAQHARLARAQALVEALPAIPFEADGASGRNVYTGPQWQAFTGMDVATALGNGWLDAVHPDDQVALQMRWQASLANGRPVEHRHRLRAADGSHRWFLTRAQPRRDSAGRIERWVGAATDIDDLARAEAALQDGDRRKDEFLAMMAHELRNPLAPIRNAVLLLGRSRNPGPDVQRATAMIDRQSAQLSRLVDDLLDISRVVNGKVVLQAAAHDARAIVEAGVETVRSLAETKGQHLALHLAEPGSCRVHGDFVRLAQVVGNLVGNAIKYTGEGGHIDVRLERCGEDELSIEVTDDGIGLDAALLPQVFDLFMQADVSLSRSGGGLGIGLAMVRRLAELHRGSVQACSDGPGRGSRFVVRLPALTTADAPAASAPAEPAAPPLVVSHAASRRLLIVDDNADAADSIAMLLGAEGYEVTTCRDGTSGEERATREPFDVVLLDLGLPDRDGLTVARGIRAHGASRQTLLVAVTGYGQPEDRARTAQAGFDAHFVKPVDVLELCMRLSQARPRLDDLLAARIEHATLHRVHAAWRELRRVDGGASLEALLSATHEYRAQRAVAVIDSVQPFAMRFLAVGERLAALLPSAPIGRGLGDKDVDAGTLESAYRRVALTGEPGYESACYTFGSDDALRFERLILPVRDEAAHARFTHLVAVVLIEPTAGSASVESTVR